MRIFVGTWFKFLFYLLGFDDIKCHPQMTRYVNEIV